MSPGSPHWASEGTAPPAAQGTAALAPPLSLAPSSLPRPCLRPLCPHSSPPWGPDPALSVPAPRHSVQAAGPCLTPLPPGRLQGLGPSVSGTSPAGHSALDLLAPGPCPPGPASTAGFGAFLLTVPWALSAPAFPDHSGHLESRTLPDAVIPAPGALTSRPGTCLQEERGVPCHASGKGGPGEDGHLGGPSPGG